MFQEKRKINPKRYRNHTDAPELSSKELNNLNNAMKDETFRNLLFDYASSLSDPKVREENEKYLQQLEKENEGPKNRKLMEPIPHLCLKERRKKSKLDFFINICIGSLVKEPHLGNFNSCYVV